MARGYSKLFIILSLCLILEPVYAQVISLRFASIGRHENLPETEITMTAQDEIGFIWVATERGLFRHDGITSKEVIIQLPNEPAKPGHPITYVYPQRKKFLWIGSDEGLFRYEREKNTWVQYRLGNLAYQVNKIVESPDGQLWIGTTQGAYFVNGLELSPMALDIERPTAGLNITDLLFHEQQLWMGTGQGLMLWDRRVDTIQHFNLNQDGLKVNCVAMGPHGSNLWIGTDLGLFLFEQVSGDIQEKKLNGIKGDPIVNINHILLEEWGSGFHLWLGTNSGLVRYFPEANKIYQDIYETTMIGSLNHNQVNHLLEGKTEVLWISTKEGLNRFAKTSEPIRAYNMYIESYQRQLQSIRADDNGNLWLGVGGGFIRFNRYSGEKKLFSFSTGAEPVWHSHYHNGKLWFASDGLGLFHLDTASGKFYRHSGDGTGQAGHLKEMWWAIFASNGLVWAGGNKSGLCRYDPKTNSWKVYKHQEGKASLSHDTVYPILEDADGSLWIGTWGGGLNHFDPRTETWRNYNHILAEKVGVGSQWVNSIVRSTFRGKPYVWTATHTGLIGIDTGFQEFQVFGAKDGFVDQYLYGLEEDLHGDLWCSSNSGLTRFNLKTKVVTNYDTSDGLHDNSFNAGLSFIDKTTGELFFGNNLGFTSFFPSALSNNNVKPQIALTSFEIFNEPVPLSSPELETPLKLPIELLDQIVLKKEERHFSITFAALHYEKPENNLYAFKMENFDDSWQNTDAKRRYASYNNLQAGNYVFRVKAANDDGVWNDDGIALNITVLPAPWQTWWAYTLYCLLIIGSIAAYLITERRIKDRLETMVAKRTHELHERNQQILETKRQLLVQEKLASLGTMAAGVAHELKNPLNFINNFASISQERALEMVELLSQEKDKLTPELQEELEDILDDLVQNTGRIHKHGLRATNTIRSMMELAAPQVQAQDLNINQVVEEYASLATRGFFAKHKTSPISLENKFEENIEIVQGNPQSIGRLIINLVNNALDALTQKLEQTHGPFAPCIEICTEDQGENVAIIVKDNGIGISKEHLSQIATPFFTTKQGNANLGLGLSICFEIVSNHYGDLKIQSKEGVFTQFTILLPKSQEKAKASGKTATITAEG